MLVNYYDMAQSLLEKTKRTGGAYHWFGGVGHIGGYIVRAGKFSQRLPVSDGLEAAYLAFMCQTFDRMGAEGLGLWVDKHTIHLDPIYWVESRLEAEMLCLSNGEASYFDIDQAQAHLIEITYDGY